VINAGANDVTLEERKPRKAKVKNRYKRIIASLRKLHGSKTHIVLMNGYGWHPDETSAYTRELVKEVGGNLSALLFPWIWERWHGSMIEHSGQAHLLAEHIESLDLGFTVVREADIFDGFGRNFDVANGSFESKAKAGFDAFGWRYFDEGVQRIYDPAGAADGLFYIRLGAGQSVHQGTDASGDFEPGGISKPQNFRVKAMIRSVGEVGGAKIIADFEAQDLWQRKNPKSKTFGVNNQWQEFTAEFTAPPGTWKTYITLTSIEGEMEFDNVRVKSCMSMETGKAALNPSISDSSSQIVPPVFNGIGCPSHLSIKVFTSSID